MEVKIVEIAPVTLACLRYTGPYGPALGTFWREVFNPWQRAHGLSGRVTYGIGLDDPHHTPPEQCRYDACVEVDDGYVAAAPAVVQRFAGGRYAATRFRGTGAEVAQAWQRFFGEALPASGLPLAYGPCVERYDADYALDPATGVFECDLLAPLKAEG